jgi:hypothetical protein
MTEKDHLISAEVYGSFPRAMDDPEACLPVEEPNPIRRKKCSIGHLIAAGIIAVNILLGIIVLIKYGSVASSSNLKAFWWYSFGNVCNSCWLFGLAIYFARNKLMHISAVFCLFGCMVLPYFISSLASIEYVLNGQAENRQTLYDNQYGLWVYFTWSAWLSYVYNGGFIIVGLVETCRMQN